MRSLVKLNERLLSLNLHLLTVSKLSCQQDKWKTLVHTASISPQQRRGEPVPQELLDRVLAAQAYWSQQQAKLQPKTPPLAEALLLT
jgi:hypothetical protein